MRPKMGAGNTHTLWAAWKSTAGSMAWALSIVRTVCSPAAMAAHVGAHSFSAISENGGAEAGAAAAGVAAELLAAWLTGVKRLLPGETALLAL